MSLAVTTLLPHISSLPSPSGSVGGRREFLTLDSIQIAVSQYCQLDGLSPSTVEDAYGCWVEDLDGNMRDKYDVFISYRWHDFDSLLTKKLYDRLTMYTVNSDSSRGIYTFLDVKRLKLGDELQLTFCRALLKSSVIVIILSKNAIEPMLHHDNNKIDNVLLEWLISQIAYKVVTSSKKKNDSSSLTSTSIGIVQKQARLLTTEDIKIRTIQPILIGSRSIDGLYNDLLKDKVIDQLPDIIPYATIERANNLLREVRRILTKTDLTFRFDTNLLMNYHYFFY